MIGRRFAWMVIAAALVSATAAFAADPAPTPGATDKQVEKLQGQLDQMSKELAQMKELVNKSNLPPQQRQMMMGHMGQMEGHMHGMMSDCCMMDPASCPAHMGTPQTTR